MKQRDLPQAPSRHDRLLKEHIHDTYKLRSKLPEPARCPECGAVYLDGRWIWGESSADDVAEVTCQACRRIHDNYPAGEIHIRGEFAAAHEEEIRNLIRNIEEAQQKEHPLKRIMSIEHGGDELLVTTTDIYLPHQIGHALHDAWEGDLEVHYDEEGYFTRVQWQRDE